LHGGAYALGSIHSHRELIARLVLATNCKALAIDYRRAPENPFPAALEDSVEAYNWLLSSGVDPSRIFIAGDSAGGGLAIATLFALREQGIPLPAGIFCFSPWLDLTLSGDSVTENMHLDPILSAAILQKYVNFYIGNHVTNNPLISPLFGDLRGLPPIHIQTGRNEILLDDSVRFYEKARQAGVDVTLKIWNDMFHVFQLFSFVPETQESMKQVTAFINRVMHVE
ncbi:MAG: alpha/beta hydrolase, partial [Anaerolineaceae bacterium]|nr:alpha/beta hydrolase [Anaerolineaceae bacterium]